MKLVPIKKLYKRPKLNFDTTTTIWPVNELISRRVKFWKTVTGEDGVSGSREGAARKDETVYSGSYSIFPVPLVEWIYLRYAGDGVRTILDPFAGGPPRGMVASLMGYEYVGYDIRQEAVDENRTTMARLGLDAQYYVGDGTTLNTRKKYDFAIACPPYYDLEVYSDDPDDISALATYDAFHDAMFECSQGLFKSVKDGAFVCIVVGNFRDKKGELVDFRGDTVANFREAGFLFWQDVVLARPAGSAAIRAGTSWKGLKLVPKHEYLLVFRKPKKERVRLKNE